MAAPQRKLLGKDLDLSAGDEIGMGRTSAKERDAKADRSAAAEAPWSRERRETGLLDRSEIGRRDIFMEPPMREDVKAANAGKDTPKNVHHKKFCGAGSVRNRAAREGRSWQTKRCKRQA